MKKYIKKIKNKIFTFLNRPFNMSKANSLPLDPIAVFSVAYPNEIRNQL